LACSHVEVAKAGTVNKMPSPATHDIAIAGAVINLKSRSSMIVNKE